MHGKGKIYYINGDEWHGSFTNDQKDGEGFWIQQNIKVCKEKFQFGKKVSEEWIDPSEYFKSINLNNYDNYYGEKWVDHGSLGGKGLY